MAKAKKLYGILVAWPGEAARWLTDGGISPWFGTREEAEFLVAERRRFYPRVSYEIKPQPKEQHAEDR